MVAVALVSEREPEGTKRIVGEDRAVGASVAA